MVTKNFTAMLMVMFCHFAGHILPSKHTLQLETMCKLSLIYSRLRTPDSICLTTSIWRTEQWLHILGASISWIKPCASNISHRVLIYGHASNTTNVAFGVYSDPRPNAFLNVCVTLAGIGKLHNVNSHTYIDDSQLYIVFHHDNSPNNAPVQVV